MNPLIECLGWTLVHFIWQGIAIALLLAIALRLLRRGTANQRYLAGCVALLLMVVAPAVTSHLVEKAEPAPAQAVSVGPVEISPNPGIAALQAAIQPKKSIFTTRPGMFRPDFVQRLEMILPWLVMGWSMGVLALSCRLLAGWLQVKRWQRTASETLAETWRQKLDELARRLSISKPVRLVQSALVEVPTVVGWLRPVILLPASCLSGLTPEQLESILAHELAHIRRHDYLVNLLQSVVETLLFYHPAVWWVSRRIREERENCCDDMAVKICGDPVTYARALATLEEMRSAPAQLAMAADGAPLLERIQRLLGKSGGNATPTAWPLAGTIVVIALMALAIGLRENRANASESSASEGFITTFGVYHYTNSGVVRKLIIQTNSLSLSASKWPFRSMADEGAWTPDRRWFVYIGKDWHVWAYDGAEGLYVIEADSRSSRTMPLGHLDGIPPDAVLKRLPKKVEQLVLPIGLRENRAMASEPSAPETFITHFGIYHFTNNGAATELTVETNKVFVSATRGNTPSLEGTSSSSAGVQENWSPRSHWFVYIGKDWHAWAYDGAQGLWLVAADSVSSKMRSLTFLDEIPPDAVLKRLPKGVEKMALAISTINSNNRQQYEEMIREATNSSRQNKGTSVGDPAKSRTKSLETRTFHLNVDELMKGLEKAGFYEPGAMDIATSPYESRKSLSAALRRFFASKGVEIPTNASPGAKMILWNGQAGVLLVRATKQDLDIIGGALNQINIRILSNGDSSVAIVDKVGMTGWTKDDQNPSTSAAVQAPNETGVPSKDDSKNQTNHLKLVKGQQAIIEKMPHIWLPSVEYDGLPLSKVINSLSEQAKLHDPAREGINFFIARDRPGSNAVDSIKADAAKQSLANELMDAGNVKVTIKPALAYFRMGDVLDEIVAGADKPIQYKILDYGIEFSLNKNPARQAHWETITNSNGDVFTFMIQVPNGQTLQVLPEAETATWTVNGQNQLGNQWFYYRLRDSSKAAAVTPPSEPLETRKYYVEPGKFMKALERAGFSPRQMGTNAQSQQTAGPYVSGGNSTRKLQAKIREYFKSLGVDFGTNTSSADKAILFNDRKGVLFVRATAKEMEVVTAALERINSEDTPAAVPAASSNPPSSAGNTATFTTAASGTQPLAHQWNFNGTNAADTAAERSRSYTTNAEPGSVNLINYKSRKIEAETEWVKEHELLTQLLSITNKEVLRKAIPMAVTDSTLNELLRIYTEAVARQVTLENNLGSSHPDAQRNKKLIAELDQQIDYSVQGILEGMTVRVASLKAECDFVDAKLAEAKTNVMVQVGKPQINIKVKFVEVTEPIGNSTGFDWVLKDSWATFTTNPTPPPKFISPYILTDSNSTTHVELTVSNSIISESMAILNERPYSMVMHSLEAQSGADILTTPEITTVDNRQAQIQSLDIMSVVLATNSTLADGKASPHPLVEIFGFGPIFDVVPKVSEDGLSIKLKMTASVNEFKGYTKAKVPTPQLYGQKFEAEATVPDGQTLILAGRGAQMTVVMKDKVAVLGSIPLLGRLFQSGSTSIVRKDLLVFVTPTLINPDGTRYHSEAESNSKSPSSPPPAIGDETKKTN